MIIPKPRRHPYGLSLQLKEVGGSVLKTLVSVFVLGCIISISSETHADNVRCGKDFWQEYPGNGYRINQFSPGPFRGYSCLRWEGQVNWFQHSFRLLSRPGAGTGNSSGLMAKVSKHRSSHPSYRNQFRISELRDGLMLHSRYRWNHRQGPTRIGWDIYTNNDGRGVRGSGWTSDIIINTRPWFDHRVGDTYVGRYSSVPGLGSTEYHVRADFNPSGARRVAFSPVRETSEKRIDIGRFLKWLQSEPWARIPNHFVHSVAFNTESMYSETVTTEGNVRIEAISIPNLR